MDLQKLKAFIVVAEELNFRKSAEILGMSQPPLTRLIAALEEELGTSLFERTTRQVTLTASGIYLLKQAREIFQSMERIESEIKQIGKIKSGDLRIGFSTAAFLAKLPRIIDAFQERFPKIKFELAQESEKEILKGLYSGDFDVAFLEGTDQHVSLKNELVKDHKLGVLLPRKHALAKKKELDFKELKNETFILHPRDEARVIYESFTQVFEQAGFKPKVYMKNPREVCPILVATGRGISLSLAGTQNIAPDDTVFVPVKNFFLPVSVYWSPDNDKAALASFLSFTLESQATRSKSLECVTDAIVRS
ncbi:LysR family transcriptional regulator [Bdellovibrio bacteriovorus]|uniref:LysR family transcriptional regulator n=1 Tax=Bdellovibrio bacteriovorus TaxID=959 RepID=A0A150WDL3_BDEBC|nr:LysR family transcriptional regulator [Bdellovibrio bacteriovorus]KYG60962.1 LysR family transcriptional regulator [Bdellovibrio bacteriovorus]